MKKELINYEIPENTDEDVIHNWEPLKKTIDSSFKYEHNNIFYKIYAFILYYLALIFLTPFNFIVFGTRIKGKKNLKKIKNTGSVIVCNHNHIMDMTMIISRIYPTRTYSLADKSSFQIPVVRHMVGALGAIPIADTLDGKRKCFAYIDKLLQNKKNILVFPEGSMWPYYKSLRPFKDGAFKFASKNNVPILPMSLTFRKPKGLFKLYKKKPLVTITIMEPIYKDLTKNEMENREMLKNKAFNLINNQIIESNKE